jgi:hypothetical protein
MLLDGRADALWGAGVGWPAFTALAKSGARIVGPSADEVKRILAEPALQAVTPPRSRATRGDAPVARWAPELCYRPASRMSRATCSRLHRAEGPLRGAWDQARETTAANTVAAAPRQTPDPSRRGQYSAKPACQMSCRSNETLAHELRGALLLAP